MAHRYFVTNSFTMVIDRIDRARALNRISQYQADLEKRSFAYVYSQTGMLPPHSDEYLAEYNDSMNRKPGVKAPWEEGC